MHTKEECYHSGPADSKGHDHTRKSQPDRILWSQEPIYASRVVSSWRTVSVALRRQTHREEETTLGTFSARRIIDRLSCERVLGLQHTRYWYRHDWLPHHSRKPRGALRAEAHGRQGTHGWYLLAQQDLRLCWRHGTSTR
jgi:hypothetical protein